MRKGRHKPKTKSPSSTLGGSGEIRGVDGGGGKGGGETARLAEDPLLLPGGVSLEEVDEMLDDEALELRVPTMDDLIPIIDAISDPSVPMSDKEVSLVLLYEVLTLFPFSDLEKYGWGGSTTPILSVIGEQLRHRGPMLVPALKLVAAMACSSITREEVHSTDVKKLLVPLLDHDASSSCLAAATEAVAFLLHACHIDMLELQTSPTAFWSASPTKPSSGSGRRSRARQDEKESSMATRRRRTTIAIVASAAEGIINTFLSQGLVDKTLYLLSMAPTIPSAPSWLSSALHITRVLSQIDRARKQMVRGRLPAILSKLQASELPNIKETKVISAILKTLSRFERYDRTIGRIHALRAARLARSLSKTSHDGVEESEEEDEEEEGRGRGE